MGTVLLGYTVTSYGDTLYILVSLLMIAFAEREMKTEPGVYSNR